MVKIKVDESNDYQELEIEIKTPLNNRDLTELIAMINTYFYSLTGKDQNNKTYTININQIYYIESVDDKTFIYTLDQLFETPLRLYELEEQLKESNLIRISKSIILNIDKLESVKSLLNGRYEAHLMNQEILIVTRHYLRNFKKKFGI